MEHLMALIVPYRNREEHLREFIPHVRRFLADFPYEIFIIEQLSGKPFNRGMLLNIGYAVSKKDCDYFCFHDIDMLPVKADYSFPDTPVHLATHVEQFDYAMPYPNYFGGVTLFNLTDFESVNGYCNEYWGWGREDDDLRIRCQDADLPIVPREGTFLSLPHGKPQEEDSLLQLNQERYEEYACGNKILQEDGLKNLHFELQSERKTNDFFHFVVKI